MKFDRRYNKISQHVIYLNDNVEVIYSRINWKFVSNNFFVIRRKVKFGTGVLSRIRGNNSLCIDFPNLKYYKL